jgi:predicted RNase H-like nuclease
MPSSGAVSLIGFDSAWTDKPSAPGAICVLRLDGGGQASWTEPQLVSFAGAIEVIRAEQCLSPLCLVALDQPTIVPNATSLRPVDRVAASLISWLGGGVQPANRSKIGMFDDEAPIWRFKAALGATENPETARTAAAGLYLMEVFPALALPSFGPEFFGRNLGPRYNPARRKTYSRAAWDSVAGAVQRYATSAGLACIAEWTDRLMLLQQPGKADQDKLDAVICALIGFAWRTLPRAECVMIGDLSCGYMVSPASDEVRRRLTEAAGRYWVSIDGKLPSHSTARLGPAA